MPDDNPTVVIYTGVGNYCLKNNSADIYRFWTAMRLEDAGGGSFMPFKTLYSLGQRMGYTRGRTWQILKKGEGIFWVDRGEGVRYISINKLLDTLDIERIGYKIRIDVGFLYKDLKTFKAALYAANFAKDSWKVFTVDRDGIHPAGGTSISRKTITEITGVSRPTQYQYEELMGIKVDAQYVHASQEQIESIPVGDRLADGRGVFLSDVNHDGQKEIVWQTANRYTVPLDYIGKSKISASRRSPIDGTAAQRKQRMFFDKTPGSKRISQDGAYVYSGENLTRRDGRYYAFVK